MGTKICSSCKIEKTIESNFWRSPQTKDGFCCWCKECFIEKRKAWPSWTVERRRRARLRSRYKITDTEYDSLVANQDGICAICKKVVELDVDHDHTTGKVRGLLCGNCNTALGKFQDSTDILFNAVVYLIRNREEFNGNQDTN